MRVGFQLKPWLVCHTSTEQKFRVAVHALDRECRNATGVMAWVMPESKLYDEFHKISDKRGNGSLRREVWVDHHGRVTRYNLAYINHNLHAGDNGRVVDGRVAEALQWKRYFPV